MQIEGQANLALQGFQDLSLAKLKGTPGGDEGEQEVAKGFEQLLARMLVSELRKSVPEGLFGGGSGSDVYASWFDEHVSNVLAEQKALGIGSLVESSLADITPEEMAERDAQGEIE